MRFVKRIIILSISVLLLAWLPATLLANGMPHHRAPPPPPPPPKEPVTIKIIWPTDKSKHSFTPGTPGELQLSLKADVKPKKYSGDVTWEIEKIGDSEMTPETPRTSDAQVTFKKLPKNNSDFGKKKITATVKGKSDSVTILVFFPPQASNHPEGGILSTTSPNWFYYWKQTAAAQGMERILRYKSIIPAKNRPTDNVIGRYERGEDAIYLSDSTFSSTGCTRRFEGGHGARNATGIDCFAEEIKHEARHKTEEDIWWKKGSNTLVRFAESFIDDRDGDHIPKWVEDAEPGCSDQNMWSCNNRPTFSTPPTTVPDTELYAYFEGWRWPLCSAKSVDWSEGGQQWHPKGKGPCP